MDRKAKVIIFLFVSVAAIIIISVSLNKTEEDIDQIHHQALDSTTCPEDFSPLPVLIVSLDGFKPQYLQRGLTPNIQTLINGGSSAPFMVPIYTSNTFPNHYTLVTGLYADSHEIVNNRMYDTSFDATFSYKNDLSKESRWWNGEPIWNTIRKNNLKSATYFWVGSEAPINGHHPTYWLPFDASVPLKDRVGKILEWLSLPKEERPSWLSLYFNEPDSTGHRFGPDSKELNGKLEEVDGVIGYLIESLRNSSLLSCVNIIIVSDHGMTSSGNEKKLNLTEMIPQKYWDKIEVSSGVSAMIRIIDDDLKNSTEERNEFEKIFTCNQNFKFFRREDLPVRLHYSANQERVGDYVFLTNDGYSTEFKKTYSNPKGVHGNDNKFSSMQAMFVAHGPSFKKNFIAKPFRNVEIYDLMCHLLNVTPAPNNGTGKLVYSVLKNPPSNVNSERTNNPQDSYKNISFANLDEVKNNSNASKCSNDKSFSELSFSLVDIGEMKKSNLVDSILPLGIPVNMQKERNITLLFHPDHITGYSLDKKIPLWSSFLVTPKSLVREIEWFSDFRLFDNYSSSCDRYQEISLASTFSVNPLFPAAFSHNQTTSILAFMTSNAVPFHSDLRTRWEDLMEEILPIWQQKSNSHLQVTVGPIFEENMIYYYLDPKDLLKEIIKVPSHYFAIILRCQENMKDEKECPSDKLDIISFIFPQKQSVKNCFSSAKEYAKMFETNVQDIEYYTGFKFFPNLSIPERLELITSENLKIW